MSFGETVDTLYAKQVGLPAGLLTLSVFRPPACRRLRSVLGPGATGRGRLGVLTVDAHLAMGFQARGIRGRISLDTTSGILASASSSSTAVAKDVTQKPRFADAPGLFICRDLC